MCQEDVYHALSSRRLFYLFGKGGIPTLENSPLLSELQSKGHKRKKPDFTEALLSGGGGGEGGGGGWSLSILEPINL